MIDPIGGVAVEHASVDGELVLPEKVRLMCDAHTRQTIAVNDALGGQITVLPRLDDDDVGPWQCDVDADTGMVFLSTEKKCIWHLDITRHSLYKRASRQFVRDREAPNKPPRWLGDFFGCHCSVVLNRWIEPLGRAVHIAAATFERPYDGALSVISVNSVYSELGLTLHPGNAPQWFARRAPSWRKLVEILQLSPLSSIRASMPWEAHAADNEAYRSLAFVGWTPQATVAILAVSATAEGRRELCHIRDEDNRNKMIWLLRGLLDALPKNAWVSLCVDVAAKWIPGHGVQGRRPISMQVLESIWSWLVFVFVVYI